MTRQSPSAARLDEVFRDQVRWWHAHPHLRARLLDWQATDRTYATIQAVLRGEKRLDDLDQDTRKTVTETIDALQKGLDQGQLDRDVVLWRGIRSIDRTFSGELIGQHRLDGFNATTIHRDTATAEFTTGAPGTTGALLSIKVPAGTPAIWVSGAGRQTPRFTGQGELLLDSAIKLSVTATRWIVIRHSDGAASRLQLLSCEVIS